MIKTRVELGMAMFLIAEAVFFFLLLLAFVYLRGSNPHLPAQLPAIYTGLLLASIFTMWRAAAGSRLWLTVTIVLGVAFLIGQGAGYVGLLRDNATIRQGLFGTTFFTLTGIHELHILIGLLALVLVPPTALRAVALYWYFFAAVGLATFLTIYIRSAA